MKLQELNSILNEISPFELQESWDNCGLQVGDLEKEVQEVFVALDIDEKILSSLPVHSTIITHHPLLFSPLKKIDTKTFPGVFIKEMIKKEINLIAMHTNYDKTHLNRYVAQEVLEWKDFHEKDFVITKTIDIGFDELLEDLKKRFQRDSINFSKVKDQVKTMALTTGSGASFAKNSGVDVYITGDVKYHEVMEAKANGVSIIDITHYGSEKFFSNSLQKELNNFNINAIIRDLQDPFNQK